MTYPELCDTDLDRVTAGKEVLRLASSDIIGFGNTASVGNTWREYRDAAQTVRERNAARRAARP